MSMKMIVLSLFDGMSGAQIALRRANISYDKYFASEIDKFAIAVTQHNFPSTIQLGSVEKVTKEMINDEVTLLVGGSPCQSFSTSGPCTGFEGKSALFWEYVRVLREIKPKYFLLENIAMKQEWRDVISESLGVQPILINSNLVSAQNRKRLYWTNIQNITQPVDRNIFLRDILEPPGVDVDNYCFSDSRLQYNSEKKSAKPYFTENRAKIGTIVSTYYKTPTDGCYIEDRDGRKRKLTPRECERLQNVPEDYTAIVSNSQRYKMIGNGFTIDVVSHIFSHLY